MDGTSAKTQRIETREGTISVTRRGRYYYAVRTVLGKKRQVYLGQSIPNIDVLNEVAKDLYSTDTAWYSKRKKELLPLVKDTNLVPLKQELLLIAGLAKARGEDVIHQKLMDVIKKMDE
jgi:hypothetical protein